MADLINFIDNDFALIFLMGFSAGFIVCGFTFAIRAAVKIATRIFKGRG